MKNEPKNTTMNYPNKYKTSEFLSPECVCIKHPNPKRDNGLLVVIQGEHCGKHV